MTGINNEEIKEEEIIDLTPKTRIQYDRKPEQDIIQEKQPLEKHNKCVYVSMQPMYPPIKVFDMKEYEADGRNIFVPYDFMPFYIDSRYRDVSVITFDFLISNVMTLYFRLSNDLFTLLGPDHRDETMLRTYGVNHSRATFLILLRDALTEYANIDGKTLYTQYSWLQYLGIADFVNDSSMKNLYKYRFIPNWVEWMRGDADITEEKVILPFRIVHNIESYLAYDNSARFAQDAGSQTFYSYKRGNAICSYICDYPFMYSVNAEGNFTESSAIYELKDPKLFEMIFAKTIATYVKRNLEMIQLPGNLVNFNFDNLIQELNTRLEGEYQLAKAESVSQFWNPYNQTKF